MIKLRGRFAASISPNDMLELPPGSRVAFRGAELFRQTTYDQELVICRAEVLEAEVDWYRDRVERGLSGIDDAIARLEAWKRCEREEKSGALHMPTDWPWLLGTSRSVEILGCIDRVRIRSKKAPAHLPRSHQRNHVNNCVRCAQSPTR